jgi:hypothetical protein
MDGLYASISDPKQRHNTLSKVVVLEYIDDWINGTVSVTQAQAN